MNFRQRIAWLLVFTFLLASTWMAYYVFEISDSYNVLALEHIQSTAQQDPSELTWRQTLTTKLVAVPFWMWLLLLLVPYLQVFCLLIACTKPDPDRMAYGIWPLYLSTVCRNSKGQANSSFHHANGSKLQHM
ncbi:lysosomal enzyme trafficking factor-like [Branchiostoma floridae x Branchiostoma japonicum]